MENKKCSNKEHKENDAISYCPECKIYMCNKCSNYHQGLFQNHQDNFDLEMNDMFINICKEINHPNKLQYFCKDHNQLCCANCITKIEGEGNGQHKDCNICFIKNIKDEKKNKLNENIKLLEDLSNNLVNTIKELKIIFEKIDESKEQIKIKIQNAFTKIRAVLNEREDELLKEVDKKYNDIYCNEDIIKEGEKLPNKIKISLEKGKLIDNGWNDDNKLSSIINDCIDIEENIKKFNLINNDIKKCKLNNDLKILFIEENFDNILQNIKAFGQIINSNLDNLDSAILNNKDIIKKFYELMLNNNIKIDYIKLLHRQNENIPLKNYINKINNKSNLIFLFFTGKKRIFGAFIKTKLENIERNEYFRDENAFVFSLDTNKIYKILVPEKAIRFSSRLSIGNSKQNKGGFYFNANSIYDKNLLNNPKIYDFQKNEELTGGFDELSCFEIFEINYN